MSDAAYGEELRTYYERAFASDSSASGFIAEEDGVAVGMVTLIVAQHPPRKEGPDRRAYVTDMFVSEHARRRGHARSLMEAVPQRARDGCITRLVLRTTETARPLYESMGFVPFKTLALRVR